MSPAPAQHFQLQISFHFRAATFTKPSAPLAEYPLCPEADAGGWLGVRGQRLV